MFIESNQFSGFVFSGRGMCFANMIIHEKCNTRDQFALASMNRLQNCFRSIRNGSVVKKICKTLAGRFVSNLEFLRT